MATIAELKDSLRRQIKMLADDKARIDKKIKEDKAAFIALSARRLKTNAQEYREAVKASRMHTSRMIKEKAKEARKRRK